MEENTQLPKEVVDRIFQEGQNMLAFAPDNKWTYIQGATAYATKLHQVEQENAELRRQNDKLKEQATGWRPLLEEVLQRHEGGLLPDRLLYLEIKKFLYGEEKITTNG